MAGGGYFVDCLWLYSCYESSCFPDLHSGQCFRWSGLRFGLSEEWTFVVGNRPSLCLDFVQGPILGFPVSGSASAGLVSHSLEGDIYLSGGDYGPEAGLIGIVFRFVAMALVFLWCHRTRQDT